MCTTQTSSRISVVLFVGLVLPLLVGCEKKTDAVSEYLDEVETVVNILEEYEEPDEMLDALHTWSEASSDQRDTRYTALSALPETHRRDLEMTHQDRLDTIMHRFVVAHRVWVDRLADQPERYLRYRQLMEGLVEPL